MENFIDSIVPIFGIIGVFGMPVFIIAIVLYFKSKEKAQFHESMQKLIESGQELSPELLQSIPGYVEDETKKNDIRSGVILIGVGAGIGLLGYFGLGNSVVWAVGLLLGAIGMATLAYGIYAKKNNLDENA
jgi:membrane-bound ClpP family serine protease